MDKILIEVLGSEGVSIIKQKYSDGVLNYLSHLGSQSQAVQQKVLFKTTAPSILDLLLIGKDTAFEEEPADFDPKGDYPMMVISIKCGSSIFIVESASSQPKKISGSIMGETTISGLIKLLLKKDIQDINAVLETAFLEGNGLNANMTVGDIYSGFSLESIGLKPEIIACSLGKVKDILGKEGAEKDIIKSLYMMLCINICSIAALLTRL